MGVERAYPQGSSAILQQEEPTFHNHQISIT